MVVSSIFICKGDEALLFLSNSGITMRSIHRDSGRGAHPSSVSFETFDLEQEELARKLQM